jgi:hypothetical protein
MHYVIASFILPVPFVICMYKKVIFAIFYRYDMWEYLSSWFRRKLLIDVGKLLRIGIKAV